MKLIYHFVMMPFFVYLVFVNVFAYIIMWIDKLAAKNKGKRISENNLFLLAFCGGSLGIYTGMKSPIYHKAAKNKFKIGIPMIFILQVIMFLYFSAVYL